MGRAVITDLSKDKYLTPGSGFEKLPLKQLSPVWDSSFLAFPPIHQEFPLTTHIRTRMNNLPFPRYLQYFITLFGMMS